MQTTSATLLERLKGSSDQAAWSRLVELYTPLLFHWGLRTGLNEAETEDLVQDVFVVLLSKLSDFDRQRDGSFRTWLRVVTINKCRERFRRKLLPTVETDGEVDPLSAVADPATLAGFWEDDYRRLVVHRAIRVMQEQFEPKTWQACWQFVVEDHPAAEVARQLGISEACVYVYSGRVLRRLREELRDLLD